MFFGHVFSILMKIVECMLKLVTEKIGIHFFLKKKEKIIMSIIPAHFLQITNREFHFLVFFSLFLDIIHHFKHHLVFGRHFSSS